MAHNSIEWGADILGDGFENATFPLHDDEEGPVVTTLVRHLPDLDPHARPALPHADQLQPFAFLALHGWNDYFYQRELARFISSIGGHFYALDLRKYGRSHLEGQTWGFITDLDDYDEELHIALDAIHAEHGEIPVILYGHSTGGLTATLWADRHPGAIAGLVLNSPWLELQGARGIRNASQPAFDALSRLSPTAVIPLPDNGFYHRTLNGDHLSAADLPADAETDPFFTTGWEPDPRYRHMPTFPVRAGWLRAILNGHAQVAEGLDIPCPILMLTSDHSISDAEWSDEFLAADSVLTVENLWMRAPFLGSKITLTKLKGAIHDVTLSRREVREAAFSEMHEFLASALK